MANTITNFLRSHTASELIANKGPLIEVNGNTSIEDTLKAITDHNILSAAVYTDSSAGKQYLGIVSVWEIMSYVAFTGYFSSAIDPPPVDPTTYDYLKFPDEPIWKLVGTSSEGKSLWIYRPEDSVYSVMEPLCKGVHRVLVGPITADSSAPEATDEAGAKVGKWAMLTQTDVVKWLAKCVDDPVFCELQKHTMENLGYVDIVNGPAKLKTLSTAKTAIEGFRKLYTADISALPVVDAETGLLVTTLSASDLRGIDSSKLKWVLLPVEQFLRNQLAGELQPPVTCTARSTYGEVLKEALNARVHRLWAVTGEGKPIGVVTFTDIINAAFFAK